jgi:hypothetical protein
MPSNLSRLFRGIEGLYGADSGLDPDALLVPSEAGVREQLLLRETEDGALEVGLALDEETLRAVQDADVHDALSDARLGDTLPVLEGLSHLVYVAEAARREKSISGLELETQAEVDKLAVVLMHRWGDARAQFEPLVDRLYYGFELIAQAELVERYETANRVALAFSRHLKAPVHAGRLDEVRRRLLRFWQGTMDEKLALAAGVAA